MSGPTAWPPVDFERLATAIEDAAARLSEPDLRAQFFGVAALIRNMERERRCSAERAEHQARLEAAMADDDEGRLIEALRAFTQFDRDMALPVDWSKVTGG